MTVSANISKTSVTAGNGSNKSWPFGFKAYADSVVKPYLVDNTTGVMTLISGDYSVSRNADQDASPGGTVTYPVSASAISSSYSVQVIRVSPVTQVLDLLYGGNFSDEDIELGLDKVVLQLQEVWERASRSLSMRPAEDAYDTTLPQLSGAGGYSVMVNGTEDGFTLAQAVAATVAISSTVEPWLNLGSAAAFLAAIGGISLSTNNTFTGKNIFQSSVVWNRGSDLSVADVAAGVLTLPDDGNYYVFTDGTALSEIATTGGAQLIAVHFSAGGNVLTHHATNFPLITKAGITTAANDVAWFMEEASGDWRMVAYHRADGQALTAASNLDLRDLTRNLVVSRASTTQVSLSADEVILQSSGGTPLRRTSVSQSGIDLTAAAGGTTGGLDTGSIAPNTWYYVWLAWDSVLGNEVLLSSTNSSAPNAGRFPWTSCARLGVFRTDGSSHIVDFDQVGNVYAWGAIQTFHNTTGAANAWTGVSVAAAVPPIARRATYVLGATNYGAGLSPYSSGHGGAYDTQSGTGATSTFGGVLPQNTRQSTLSIPYVTSTIYYYFLATATQHISCVSFEL